MKQTMFGRNGRLVRVYEGMGHTERRRLLGSMKIIDEFKRLVASCPWCLYVGTLNQFTRVNETTGAVLTLFECPDCYQNMKQYTTTILDQGGANYSEWFWDQVFSYHAHDRVSWDKVKRRVKILGFDQEFWGTYRGRKNLGKSAVNTES